MTENNSRITRRDIGGAICVHRLYREVIGRRYQKVRGGRDHAEGKAKDFVTN